MRQPDDDGPANSTLEGTLARTIEAAASAQRWDIVAQLARELEARRFARDGVLELAAARAKRS
jgi:hypothetical protein